MIDRPDTLLHIFRSLFGCVVIAAGLLLLSYMFTAFRNFRVEASGASSSSSLFAAVSEQPNIVEHAVTAAAHDISEIGRSTDSFGSTIAGGVSSAATFAGQTSLAIGRGIKSGFLAATRTTGKVVASVGNALVSGVTAVVGFPGKALAAVIDAPVVRKFTRPSDNMEIPLIDPNSPELARAVAALPPTPATSTTPAQVNQGPVWPMRGRVTVRFGVDHRPYQRTHSGIDISDGKPSGSTPVQPFRPGRVISTIHSRYGFGNHVIVDHGNGITSVYAHLASITATPGQEVAVGSVLGYAGSTGMSTGTHLHFEIRVNGQAADPRKFISGAP